MNIKEMVNNNKKVNFVKYHNLELWYVTECGFEFPIPISPSETGDTPFLAQDKAMLFMRWIKKHIDNINKAKAEQK
ncbi:hypothetical protein GW796_07040 [archaeon]|nr:hypothetical protein [archaeon]